MSVLYVNACVRKESRTDRLARRLLEKLGRYEEVNLQEEGIAPLNEERLTERTRLLEEEDYSSEIFRYAKQFKEADTIVISAPFWDYSFPSLLKVYLENVYAVGLVSKYGEDGMPIGLCSGKKLYYVTTAGGQFVPVFGYEYVKSLAQIAFGIKEVELIKAEMLDIVGNDPEEIMQAALEDIDKRF